MSNSKFGMLENREEYLKQFGMQAKNSKGFENRQESVEHARRLRHSLAYICIYASNYVSVLDIDDARKLQEIEVDVGPLDIVIDRAGRFAYVSNFIANTVSVIDLRRSRTIKTVPAGSGPAGIRLSRDNRYLYVAQYDEPVVNVRDAMSLETVTQIPLPSPGFEIDITADGAFAFVGLRSAAQIAIVDLTVNLVVKVIAAGAGTEFIRVSPNNRQVFVSNEDGNSITTVNIALGEPASPNIPTLAGPVGLALTQDGRRLYCANRQDASVSVFDVFTHAQIARIPAGLGPYGAQMACGDRSLVVTNTYENTASIISTRHNRVTATVEVGDAPAFLAIL